jgi:hypothetical protein
MMSCTTSATWSRPVPSPCYTEHGQRYGAILSGHITTVVISRSGQLGLRCTVEPNCSGMSACLVDASVTCDRALDTCEPSCVPGVARPFFIPVGHNPLGAWGTWQHQSSPLGEARSGQRGSAGAHLSREVRSVAEEQMATPELNSAWRRGPGPRDTWQHRSSPQQGGEVRDLGTHGGSGAHLYREVWSKATACVAARGRMPCSLS